MTCEEDAIKDIVISHSFIGGREVFGPGVKDPGPVDGPDPGLKY